MIVIHHTGQADIDASAEQIHEWHQNQGWSGIGYHFVVRKDGAVERGRPIWAVGAHAQGDNRAYHRNPLVRRLFACTADNGANRAHGDAYRESLRGLRHTDRPGTRRRTWGTDGN